MFSTVVRAVVVASSRFALLGILFLTSFTFALRVVLVAMLVVSDIWSSVFLVLASFLIYLH